MSTTTNRRSCWTDAYLLSHCERYSVETPDGERVGVVENIDWDDEWAPEPRALIVRSLDSDRVVAVSPEDVSEVQGWAERIVLPARITDRLRVAGRRLTSTGAR
jgi:hypothetical protein